MEKYLINQISVDGLNLSKQGLTNLIVRGLDKSNNNHVVFVIPSLSKVAKLFDEFFEAVKFGKYEEQKKIINELLSIHIEMAERLIPGDSLFELKVQNELWRIVRWIRSHFQLASSSVNGYFPRCAHGASLSSLIFSKFLEPLAKNYLIDPKDFIICANEIKPQISLEKSIKKTKYHFHFKRLNPEVSIAQGYASFLSNPDLLGEDDGDLIAAIVALALARNGDEVHLVNWNDNISEMLANLQSTQDGNLLKIKVSEYLEFSKNNQVPVPSECVDLLFVNNFSTYPKVSICSFKNLSEPEIFLV